MVVAELFVNLGIKGADKTVGALSGVEKGLKGLSSMSLEAKAAIVGAMYALQQLFSKSGEAGTELTNFNALLGGKSVQTLQQYQYAARQVGISNEETAGTFKNLQSVASKIKLGEGAPKGLAQVAMLTGGISTKDIDQFMQNPELLLQRLQQYAQKEKRVGIRNETLKSFGLSDNMIAGVSRNAFRPDVLNKAPTYSDNEVSRLDKANIAWSNLGNSIQMAIGHFNAAHGGQLVGDISKLVPQVLKLANAFVKLAEQAKAFEVIGMIFQGWVDIFSGLTSAIQSLVEISGKLQFLSGLSDLGENASGKEKGKAKPGMTDIAAGVFGSLFEDITVAKTTAKSSVPTKKALPTTIQKEQLRKTPLMPTSSAFTPKVSSPISTENKTQNVNINQNLSFSHDAKDVKQNADAMKKAVRDAFRQLPSQVQGS